MVQGQADVQKPPAGKVRLCLLGGLELRSGGQVVLDRAWPRSRAKALLKLVALAGQIHRDRVVDTLWPDLDAQAGAANLRKNLHHLRTAMARHGIDEALITIRDDVLELGRHVVVDVIEFHALAQAAVDQEDPEALASALAVYRGELLPEDLYEEWTVVPRRALQQPRRQLLVESARRLEAAGDRDLAAQRLGAVLESDPFDEEVHRALIRLHLASGRRHRALRQFQDCARLLRGELGIEPSAETLALRDAALASPTAVSVDGVHFDGGVARDPIFGREAELEQGLNAVDAAVGGAGGTLLVAGVAGIGKSRLVAELVAAAGGADARTAVARCYELEASVAYQPVRDALRQLAENNDIAVVLGHTVYAKRLLPGAGAGPVPVADPVLLESELVDETVHVLIRLTAARPLVLAVEDLHAADSATIRLLHVLGRHLAGHAGLLVLSYRSDEIVAGSPADRLIVSLRQGTETTEVDLGPLSDGVIELVVRERFAPDAVDPALLRRAVGGAEGNPLFAIELVATLRETGGARLVDGRWQLAGPAHHPTPTAVRNLVERRLAGLDRPAREVVSLAALLGRTFDLHPLARALGAGDDEVLDALDRAIDASIVEEDVAGYRFRHELVRAAVCDRLSAARRRRLHRAAADAMVAAGVRAGVGHHLAASDEPWRAVPFLGEDARRAASLFANAAAAALYEEAIVIARAHAERVGADTLAGLLEELGDLRTRTGDATRGAQCLSEALEHFRGADDLAAMRVRAKAALGHIIVGEVGPATELLQSQLSDWERVLASADEGLAPFAPSAALAMLADIRWHSGEHHGALEAAERAVMFADTSGDPAAQARAYESFALACHSLGDWRRGLEYELQRGALGLPGFTDIVLDAHY